ncbi:unnamed protein product, partial [Linum tenue]
MLENWRRVGGYAWGAALLAYLYREMVAALLGERRAVVPLICFSVVMWHHPDRVPRQFGMMQNEPHHQALEAEI